MTGAAVASPAAALAEVFEVTLLTGDRRIAKAAGPRCVVELFEPPH